MVLFFDARIGLRIIRNIGCIEDTFGAARVVFVAQLGTHRVRHHRMPALDDFPQEARTDRIDEVSGKNSACEQIHGHGITGMLIVVGQPIIVEVVPEFSGIDATVFNFW